MRPGRVRIASQTVTLLLVFVVACNERPEHPINWDSLATARTRADQVEARSAAIARADTLRARIRLRLGEGDATSVTRLIVDLKSRSRPESDEQDTLEYIGLLDSARQALRAVMKPAVESRLAMIPDFWQVVALEYSGQQLAASPFSDIMLTLQRYSAIKWLQDHLIEARIWSTPEERERYDRYTYARFNGYRNHKERYGHVEQGYLQQSIADKKEVCLKQCERRYGSRLSHRCGHCDYTR